MQLQEKYGDRVQAISLNVDYEGDAEGPSEELRAKIVSALKKLNVVCENVISSDPMDDVLKPRMSSPPSGSTNSGKVDEKPR